MTQSARKWLRVRPRAAVTRTGITSWLKPVGFVGLAALPAALTIFLSFNAGGFFPGTEAFVLVVLTVALAARFALARSPLEGFSLPLGIAAGALALYAVWTLASGARSDSLWRALVEFDRVLLYLMALLFFGSFLRTGRRITLMVRLLALGIVVVAVAGLLTRLLPEVFPTEPNLANNRLSYPLTYWNALGILATLGIILCLHLTSRARGANTVRILSAAAVPPLATTVYFTFSRGAIVAAGIGIAACLLLGRPRGTLSGLVATVPATVIAVSAAYDADLLASPTPTTAAAVAQGHDVAATVLASIVVAALVRAALIAVDARLARIKLTERTRARIVRPLWAAAGLALVVAALAAGVPDYVEQQYERFASGEPPAERSGDLRERLTEPGSPVRLRTWEVARWQFGENELAGQGASTWELAWAARRPYPASITDAHSLYQEVLGEMGLVGLVLLGTALVGILARFAMGIRGSDKPLYAALFAAGIAWAAHAGIDWDWEMPAVTLWLFALGGAALASPRRQIQLRARRTLPRVAVTLALLALSAVPTLVAVSQGHLQESAEAFARQNCAAASREAKAAISTLSVNPKPYEVAAYCAIQHGRPERAVSYMEDALERDPRNWNYHYSLAVARGAAGLNPRKEAHNARRLNPREPLVQDLVRRFKTNDKTEWRSRADDLAHSFAEL